MYIVKQAKEISERLSLELSGEKLYRFADALAHLMLAGQMDSDVANDAATYLKAREAGDTEAYIIDAPRPTQSDFV